jgi:hypothetical protein
MNVMQLLRLPWAATYPSLRWFAVIVFALCSAGAIAIGVFADGAGAVRGALTMYGCGLAYLWAFFFPLGLMLAIDARQLRVPGVQRRIHASLLLYGLLGIALPLLVPGTHAGALAVMALFSAGGLSLALMPRYLAVLIAMTPSLATALWVRLDLPGIHDPRFAPWAGVVAKILLYASAWRWRKRLRAGERQAGGWSSPMVLQFRNGSWGHWNCIGEHGQLGQRPDWLQPGVDLAGVGPAKPRKALRITLGGWYLPQTVGSYGKQLVFMVGIFTIPLASIVVLSRIKSAEVAATLASGLVPGFSALLVLAAPAICILSLLWLGKRWQRANAELSLLALLPGLGDPAAIKRQLLRTALGLPLGLHVLLALLLGALMLFWHGHAGVVSYMLLAVTGSAIVTAAVLLDLLGGHALSSWRTGLILGVTSVLALSSLLLPAIALGRHPVSEVLPLLPLLPLGWLLLTVTMAWLGRRGWRALMQRPHPFLAD